MVYGERHSYCSNLRTSKEEKEEAKKMIAERKARPMYFRIRISIRCLETGK